MNHLLHAAKSTLDEGNFNRLDGDAFSQYDLELSKGRRLVQTLAWTLDKTKASQLRTDFGHVNEMRQTNEELQVIIDRLKRL